MHFNDLDFLTFVLGVALIDWVLNVAAAITKHLDDPDTQNARKRSGVWGPPHERWKRSGLSGEELIVRDQRQAAKRNIAVAEALCRETADRTSWYRYGTYSQRSARTEYSHLQWWMHREWPRSFHELKRGEQHLLTRLQNGELADQHQDAVDRHGGPVSAKRFRVG